MPPSSEQAIRSVTARETHYPALDGLRGLAVLLVLMHHFVLGSNGGFLARLTLFMWSGVDLFFVLSGFLITGILLDAKGKPRYFRTFYARRVLRISPLYYGVLLILLVVLPAFGFVIVPSGHYYYWGYLTNIDVALHGWPNQLVSHFWTLAIEEQFYLIWPLVIFLIPIRILRLGVPLMILVPMAIRLIGSLNGYPIISLQVGTLSHCDGLIMGSAIAVFLRTTVRRWRINDRLAVVSVIIICLIFVLSSFGYLPITFLVTNWNILQRTISFTLISLAFSWILVLCIGSANGVQQFFTHRGLQWMGRYSYGLYVLHKPLIAAINAIPLPVSVLHLTLRHHEWLNLIYVPLYFTVSIAAAYLSFHLLEKRFLKLKKHFSYHSKGDGHASRALPDAIVTSPAFESSYS